MIDYSEIIWPTKASIHPPMWWCDAHEWAINADNSGRCIRCKLYVKSHRDIGDVRCIPRLERAFADWKQMTIKEKNENES